MAKDSNTNIDFNVTTQYIKPSLEQIGAYVEAQQLALAEGRSLNLNEYLKAQRSQANDNVLIIADLSGMHLGKGSEPGQDPGPLLNLRGADFSGCIMENVNFTNCDLSQAVISNTNLKDVKFDIGNNITDLDLRGSNLSSVKFDEEYSNPGKATGVKLSMNKSLIDYYNSNQWQEEQKQLLNQQKKIIDREIELKEQKLQEARSALPLFAEFRGKTEELKAVNDLIEELGNLYEKRDQQQVNPSNLQEQVIDPTLLNIVNNSTNLDPCYKANSNFAERNVKKEYVPMTREDMEAYLAELKNNPKLSINDYAKQKLLGEGKAVDPNLKYIADFSNREGNLSLDKATDLSGLRFNGADFSDGNFIGVNFDGSQFIDVNMTNANMEKASFHIIDLPIAGSNELANMPVLFQRVIGDGANLKNIDGNEIIIDHCSFNQAQFSRSNASYGKISHSKFNYTNTDEAQWKGVQMNNCTFNGSSMQSMILSGNIQECQFQKAILFKAILDGAEFIKSDFTNAYGEQLKARGAKFKECVLKGFQGAKCDLTGAEIDQLTTLEEADLHKAILVHMRAHGNFKGANLDGVNAESADFTDANLEDVKARFANFKAVIMNNVDAQKIDLTGSDLQYIQAIESNFQGGIINGANLAKGQFYKVNFSDADLQNTDFYRSTMELVKINRAKVNVNTNLAGVEQKNVTGNAIDHDLQGNPIQEIKAADLQKRSEQMQNLNAGKSWGLRGKIIGVAASGTATVLNYCRNKVNDTGNFIHKKLKPKKARLICGLIGLIAASVVLAPVTMGGSLALTAAGVGGIAACTAVGVAVGHFYGDKIGASPIIATVGSFLAGVPAFLAPIVGFAGDRVVKEVTGKDIAENLTSIGLAAGAIIGMATGGVGLATAIAGAAAGGVVDQQVEKLTGKSIAQLGDNAVNAITDKLAEVALNNKIEIKPEDRLKISELVEERNRLQANQKVLLTDLQQNINSEHEVNHLTPLQMAAQNAGLAQKNAQPEDINAVHQKTVGAFCISNLVPSPLKNLLGISQNNKNQVANNTPVAGPIKQNSNVLAK